MKPGSDWAAWEALWRSDRTSAPRLEALIAQTRRARRTLFLLRLLPAALALLALAVVAAALRHAGNAFEVALGVVVAIGIVTVWSMSFGYQRQAREKVDAPADEYVAARRAVCLGQIRFAALAWIVTALDLLFLIPWWIGGFAVHGTGFHVMQLLTLWGPLAVMIAFVLATLRLRRRAIAELATLRAAPDTR